MLLTRPDAMRAYIGERDQLRCQECGADCSTHLRVRLPYGNAVTASIEDGVVAPFVWVAFVQTWQVDHIYPLWLVDRAEPDAIRWWGPENCRLLCLGCHARKTAQEAAQRAKGARIREKGTEAAQDARAARRALLKGRKGPSRAQGLPGAF